MKRAKRIKRTSNNIAGVAGYTAGELAVVRSMMQNDVKNSISSPKGKQKTIESKQHSKHHRRLT